MDELRAALAQDPPLNLSVTFGTTRGPGSILLSPFYLLRFIARMLSLRLTGRLDLVHINLASYGSTWRKLIVAKIASLTGLPYVINLHGGLYRDFWRKQNRLIQREIHSLFANAKRIIVLGEVWKNFVIQSVPETQDRVIILPNATRRSPRVQCNSTQAPMILFLGRVSAGKGVPQLIEALGQLKSLPNWTAVIAGDGDLKTARARISELGLTDRVELPGWIDSAGVTALMDKAAILTLPSFDENLPMSVIEGMAAGLAVVATPVGAIEDILTDGENGLLVPPGDVLALSTALHQLINNPALRQQLGAAAADFHRQHLDIDVYAQKLLKIWNQSAS
nr:glycosyltransferase family 4 protein [Marichromatium bheemlicum]